MKTFKVSLILLSALTLISCFEPKGETASSSFVGGTTGSFSNIVFPGAIEAVNTVTGIRVRWASAGDQVVSYRIYRITGNRRILLATTGPNATSYIDGTTQWGQIYNYQVRSVDSGELEDNNAKVVNSLAWGGIGQVNSLSRTSLEILFTSTAAVVDEVRIYAQPAAGGTKRLVGTVTGSDLSFTVEDLRVGTAYKISAQAYVRSLAKEDGNPIEILASTKTEGYHDDGLRPFGYQNVLTIRAFGDSPGAPISITEPARTPQARQIEIVWNPFYNRSDAETEYVLVRALEGQTLDTTVTTACSETTDTSCLVCRTAMSPSGTFPNCKDDKIRVAPARYQYAIALIHKDPDTLEEWTEILPEQNREKYVLVVPVPPTNMVLTQRDAVNKEICNLMSSTSDPLNNNRCAYNGIGATPYSTGPNKPALNFEQGYYDFGYNLFVDRFEAACNWTRQVDGGMCNPSSTAGNPVAGDCVGMSLPTNDQGKVGDVFWKVSSTSASERAECFLKVASDRWVRGSSGDGLNASASLPILANMMTNDPSIPFRPPMTWITSSQAQLLCSTQTDTAYGPKRLPRMREKQAFLAWPVDLGDPKYVSPTDAQNLEHGAPTKISKCFTYGPGHSNTIFPTTAPADITAMLQPSNSFAEIATNTYGQKRTFIGSAPTADCQSRYGVQDGIGNVAEFASDTFGSFTTGNVLTGGVSLIESGNRDLVFNGAGVKMNGVFGTGGNSVALGTGYRFTDTRLSTVAVPLGLPLATSSADYTSKTSTKLNLFNDLFIMYRGDISASFTPFAANVTYGGSSNDASGSGRWFFNNESAPGVSWLHLGFRCVLPAE